MTSSNIEDSTFFNQSINQSIDPLLADSFHVVCYIVDIIVISYMHVLESEWSSESFVILHRDLSFVAWFRSFGWLETSYLLSDRYSYLLSDWYSYMLSDWYNYLLSDWYSYLIISIISSLICDSQPDLRIKPFFRKPWVHWYSNSFDWSFAKQPVN